MTINDLRWWEQAACRDAPPEARGEFVLTSTDRHRRGLGAISAQLDATVNARAVCATCAGAEGCLRDLWFDEYAVAGGTVPAQRSHRFGELIDPLTRRGPGRKAKAS